ncbi:hypothetical protein bcgnr5369_31300 [Bacillus cereus]
MPNNKIFILKETKLSKSNKLEINVETYYEKPFAEEMLKTKAENLVGTQGAIISSSEHLIELNDGHDNKYTLHLVPSTVNDRSQALPEKLTNLSKNDILRRYHSLESLCQSLDSCYDLHDLGYVDKETQNNYEALATLSALELWSRWKEAHGEELY